MPTLSRFRSLLVAASAAALFAGCCADGTCIKPPPCRPCEDPCCLTPVQKTALKGGDHALYASVAYTWGGKTFVLLTEKGKTEFEKDPGAFAEKGAIRLIGGGRTLFLDMKVKREEVDLDAIAARATPYVPPAP